MILEEEILKKHSKLQCQRIVYWVGDSQKRFDGLFNILMQKESILTQRAAWPVSYCVEAHPEFIQNKFERLIKKLNTPVLHDAIKRDCIRMLRFVFIPEKYRGEIMDLCFRYLEAPKEKVAIKVFSLYVLANLAKLYPEISGEIRLLIEDQLPNQSGGFTSAAKKVFKQLKQQQQFREWE
jgi:hypothetical protein